VRSPACKHRCLMPRCSGIQSSSRLKAYCTRGAAEFPHEPAQSKLQPAVLLLALGKPVLAGSLCRPHMHAEFGRQRASPGL
jgi:hypothetical protein